MLANGVDMKSIQVWMGHSNFSTTARLYAHTDYTTKLRSARATDRRLKVKRQKKKRLSRLAKAFFFYAGGRTRTGTVSPPVDFESTTSANSITPASISNSIPHN